MATKHPVKPSDDEWNFSSNSSVVVPAVAVVVPVAAVVDLVAAQVAAVDPVVHPAVEAEAAVEAVGVDARKKQLVQNWLYGE
ncbi:MAG: hypothetical protein GY888_28390 [Planctomycetaceae bacterium]|nr:hypothetical protein [Planctomycetaceae bacterium]